MKNPATLTRFAIVSFFPVVLLLNGIAFSIPLMSPKVAAFLTEHAPILPGILGIVPTLIAVFVHAPFARSLYREAASIIHEKNFKICPHCEYDLTTVQDPDRCPECGRQSTHRHRVAFWNQKIPKDLRKDSPR
jgi:hypothetical protein